MSYGSKLSRFALLALPNGDHYFSWLSHHSVMDGWCLKIALGTLHTIYWGQSGEAIAPFSGFIKYLESVDKTAAAKYWKDELEGSVRAAFPPAKTEGQYHYNMFHKTIPTPETQAGSITRATIIRAAFSLVF